jgi:hypothetical protein
MTDKFHEPAVPSVLHHRQFYKIRMGEIKSLEKCIEADT